MKAILSIQYQNEDGKFGNKPAPIQSFWIDVKNSPIGLIQAFPLFEQNVQF